jgi:cysteine synthase
VWCGSGAGGTVAGTSAFLKTVHPAVQCYLADCAGSSLFHFVHSGGGSMEALPGSTVMEGIGINRITANFSQAQVRAVRGLSSAYR